MPSGSEDPNIFRVGLEALAKVIGTAVVGIGSLIVWIYRRLEVRVQSQEQSLSTQNDRLSDVEERLRSAPSREEMDRKLDQIHDDIRGVHTRLDRIFETRQPKE